MIYSFSFLSFLPRLVDRIVFFIAVDLAIDSIISSIVNPSSNLSFSAFLVKISFRAIVNRLILESISMLDGCYQYSMCFSRSLCGEVEMEYGGEIGLYYYGERGQIYFLVCSYFLSFERIPVLDSPPKWICLRHDRQGGRGCLSKERPTCCSSAMSLKCV